MNTNLAKATNVKEYYLNLYRQGYNALDASVRTSQECEHTGFDIGEYEQVTNIFCGEYLVLLGGGDASIFKLIEEA